MPTKFVLSVGRIAMKSVAPPKDSAKTVLFGRKISKNHFDNFLQCANVPSYNVA